MISVNVEYLEKKQTIQMEESSTVKQLLVKMSVNPETVLVGRDGEIILETENLRDGDSIEFIRVISGG